MSKILTVAIVAIALTALSQPVLARDAASETTVRVSSAGVDFGDPVAVKAFYNKLSRVAASVCDSNSSNSVVGQSDQACTDQALMLAVHHVDEPMLTQLHDRNHVRTPSALASR